MRAKEKQRTKRVGRDGAKLGRSFYFIDNNVNCVRYRYVGEERTYVVRHKHSVGGGESRQLVHEGKESFKQGVVKKFSMGLSKAASHLDTGSYAETVIDTKGRTGMPALCVLGSPYMQGGAVP